MHSDKMQQNQKPCYDFMNTGTCSRGQSCKFSHAPPTQNTNNFNSQNQKPCYDFMNTGSCQKGPNCKFSHGPSNNSNNNNQTPKNTGVCYEFQNTGSCKKGQNCKYIHDSPQQTSSNNNNNNQQTQQICKKFQTDSCTYGKTCKYAHTIYNQNQGLQNQNQGSFNQNQGGFQYNQGFQNSNQGGGGLQMQIQTQQPSQQQTQKCKYQGNCNKGDQCKFLHSNGNDFNAVNQNQFGNAENWNKSPVVLIQHLNIQELTGIQDQCIKILKYQQYIIVIGVNNIFSFKLEDNHTAPLSYICNKKIESDIHYAAIFQEYLILGTSKPQQLQQIWILPMQDLNQQIIINDAHQKPITCIYALQDMKIILSSSEDGFIKCWNQENYQYVLSQQISELLSKLYNYSPIYFMDVFSYNNKQFLLITLDQAKAAIIDLDSGKPLQVFDLNNSQSNSNQIITQIIINTDQNALKLFANILHQPFQQQGQQYNQKQNDFSSISAFVEGNSFCSTTTFIPIYPDQQQQQKQDQKFKQNIITKTILIEDNLGKKILVSGSANGGIQIYALAINAQNQNTLQSEFKGIIKAHKPYKIFDLLEYVVEVNMIKIKFLLALDEKNNLTFWKINL